MEEKKKEKSIQNERWHNISNTQIRTHVHNIPLNLPINVLDQLGSPRLGFIQYDEAKNTIPFANNGLYMLQIDFLYANLIVIRPFYSFTIQPHKVNKLIEQNGVMCLNMNIRPLHTCVNQ